MTLDVTAAPPADLLPAFAALYGVPASELGWLADTLEQAWAVTESDALLGVAGVRPSPAHGMELMGGALPGTQAQEEAVTVALVQAACLATGRLYAFADGGMLTAAALERAGLQEVAAYRLLAGPVPQASPPEVSGISFRRWGEVTDPALRLEALATYEDRIGHHAVSPEAARDGAGGFDPQLSLIALDGEGRAAGICRAAPEDGYLRIDAPGVRPDLRATSLRRALLLEVCRLARSRGFGDVSVEGWGDLPEELADDLGLGLEVQIENPIYATPGSAVGPNR